MNINKAITTLKKCFAATVKFDYCKSGVKYISDYKGYTHIASIYTDRCVVTNYHGLKCVALKNALTSFVNMQGLSNEEIEAIKKEMFE